MCTSIVSNRKKTIVGWNLDILNMEYKIVAEADKVYIAIKDENEGWLPLFGANHRRKSLPLPSVTLERQLYLCEQRAKVLSSLDTLATAAIT